MLRVSRDGTEVWVQTAVANTNVVLAADDLAELATESTGKGPITNAGTPDGRYRIITNAGDTYASLFDAKTYREVKRLEIGGMKVALLSKKNRGETVFFTMSLPGGDVRSLTGESFAGAMAAQKPHPVHRSRSTSRR